MKYGMTRPSWGPGTRLWKSIRYCCLRALTESHVLTRQQLYHSIHAKGENVEDILQAAEGTADGQVDDVDSMQTDIAQTEVAGNEAGGESHGAKGKQRADEPEVCYENLFICRLSVCWLGIQVAPSAAEPPLETENLGGATGPMPGGTTSMPNTILGEGKASQASDRAITKAQ